jgi:hypothetical protein
MENERLLNNNEICKACPAVNMRATKHLQLRCHPDKCIVIDDFRGIAKAQDTNSIAAHDKWWIEGIEKVFGRTKAYFCMNPDFPKCEFCTEFYMKPCVYFEWQSLTQSLEAK